MQDANEEKQQSIESSIEEAVNTPASGRVDGQSYTSRSIDDLIKADRYLSSKRATKKSRYLGLKFAKIEHGGPLG